MNELRSIKAGVFSGDPSKIASVDVDQPITNIETTCCAYYVEPYGESARTALDNGDKDASAVYVFLQAICSFNPRFDTPEEPFGPMVQSEGKRSCVPFDLTPVDVSAIREIVSVSKDPILLARLFDVLWIYEKNHEACAKAAEYYLAIAEDNIDEDIWIYSVLHFQRAISLAANLGRKKELYQSATKRLQEIIEEKSNCSSDFLCCQLMGLLIRFRCGDYSKFADIAAGIAQRAEREGDYRRTMGYWEVGAELYRLAKDEQKEINALLAAGEALVKKAELRTQGEKKSFMAAATILRQGIEALMRAKAAPKRVKELRILLSEYQLRSKEEYQYFSSETIDLSDAVNSAREQVMSESFPVALTNFILGIPLIDLEKSREQVVEMVKGSPFFYLFSKVLVDEKARPIAKMDGFPSDESKESNRLDAEMFSLLRTHAQVYAVGYINPARIQILNDHHPAFGDLLFLVRNNPFVPPGHQETFLRGLHAGFHGDWVVASHLLVPQIENSMRYVLESQGIDVSNMKSDGTQPVKVFGGLFDLKETVEIFGEELCFTLRGCLIEKAGFDLRNKIAHGFASDEDCYSSASQYIWWLVLRFCLFPLIPSIMKTKEADS